MHPRINISTEERLGASDWEEKDSQIVRCEPFFYLCSYSPIWYRFYAPLPAAPSSTITSTINPLNPQTRDPHPHCSTRYSLSGKGKHPNPKDILRQLLGSKNYVEQPPAFPKNPSHTEEQVGTWGSHDLERTVPANTYLLPPKPPKPRTSSAHYNCLRSDGLNLSR